MKIDHAIEIRLINKNNMGYILKISNDKIERIDITNGIESQVCTNTPKKLIEVQELLNFAYLNAAKIIEETTELKK
tara:strand:+ start:264 stop:491 length:228 start_codon:yes stop_codon:yes gene_type:complete